MTRTCGCPGATFQRVNPTTGVWLLLCEGHAHLHDQGHAFTVYSVESESPHED